MADTPDIPDEPHRYEIARQDIDYRNALKRDFLRVNLNKNISMLSKEGKLIPVTVTYKYSDEPFLSIVKTIKVPAFDINDLPTKFAVVKKIFLPKELYSNFMFENWEHKPIYDNVDVEGGRFNLIEKTPDQMLEMKDYYDRQVERKRKMANDEERGAKRKREEEVIDLTGDDDAMDVEEEYNYSDADDEFNEALGGYGDDDALDGFKKKKSPKPKKRKSPRKSLRKVRKSPRKSPRRSARKSARKSPRRSARKKSIGKKKKFI